MKKRKYKIFGCLLLIGAITVSFGITLADADAGFGKTITTAKMANMFGGGLVWGCDTDCDTTGTGCPGGSTECGTEPEDNGNPLPSVPQWCWANLRCSRWSWLAVCRYR